MSIISQFTIGVSRTINLGNFESMRVETSITVDVNDSEDFHRVAAEAQVKLRELLENTYRAQAKKKDAA
jgi:hypothetical protein